MQKLIILINLFIAPSYILSDPLVHSVDPEILLKLNTVIFVNIVEKKVSILLERDLTGPVQRVEVKESTRHKKVKLPRCQKLRNM